MARLARHWPYLAFAVLAVVYVLAATVRPVYGHDASVYQGLARAILDGHGYVFDGAPHTQYPPGQPLFVAAVFAAGGGLLAVQRWIASIAVLAGVLCYAWLVPRGRWLAVAIALLTLLSTHTFRESIGGLRSEPLYLALSMSLLWLSDARMRAGRAGITAILLAAALACVSVATRTIGIAWVAAAAATLVQQRLVRPRQRVPEPLLLAVAIGGALAFAGWTAWTVTEARPLYEGDGLYSYTAQLRLLDPHQPDLGTASLGDLLVRIPAMLEIQLGHVAECVFNVSWVQPMYGTPVVALTTGTILIGVVDGLRGRDAFAGWYVSAFAGILALWPFDEGARFVQPALPLLLLFGFRGARIAIDWFGDTSPRRRRVVVTGISLLGLAVWFAETRVAGWEIGRQALANAIGWCVLAAVPWVPWTVGPATWRRAAAAALAIYVVAFAALGVDRGLGVWRSEANPSAAAARMDHLVDAIDWLRDHATEGSRVMCEQYAAVHIGTGLPTVPLPRTGRPEVLAGAIRDGHVDFLIVQDTPEHPYYFPVEEARLAVLETELPDRIRLVHSYAGGRLFSVDSPR